jgi:hypothetical protein
MRSPVVLRIMSGWLPGVLFAMLLSGCAPAPRLFVNRQADMTLYKKVVVVPFSNLTVEAFAPGRIVRALTTELVIADRFQMIDPSTLLGELVKANVAPDATGQIELGQLRSVATKLGATAIIRGSVTEYGIHRQGTDEYPVVGFDCEMVDVQTGIVIWRMSVNETGRGRLPIIGGSGERTFVSVTQAACKHAVATLRAKIL